jgi:hypothetical protein
MNLFSFFEAHRNPLVRLMDWIGRREKQKLYGIPERVIAVLGRMTARSFRFVFS